MAKRPRLDIDHAFAQSLRRHRRRRRRRRHRRRRRLFVYCAQETPRRSGCGRLAREPTDVLHTGKLLRSENALVLHRRPLVVRRPHRRCAVPVLYGPCFCCCCLAWT